MSRLLWSAILAATLGGSIPASAAVTFAFEETGAGVFGTLSGTLDTTGLSFGGSSKTGAGIGPSLGAVISGSDGAMVVASLSSLPTFGSGGVTDATGTTGDLFILFSTGPQRFLSLPSGWTSGNSLSGTLSFAGSTFASLGITPGSYVTALPNDTITLSFAAAVVPLPPAAAALGLGLLALGAAARRRRRG